MTHFCCVIIRNNELVTLNRLFKVWSNYVIFNVHVISRNMNLVSSSPAFLTGSCKILLWNKTQNKIGTFYTFDELEIPVNLYIFMISLLTWLSYLEMRTSWPPGECILIVCVSLHCGSVFLNMLVRIFYFLYSVSSFNAFYLQVCLSVLSTSEPFLLHKTYL